MPSFYRGKIAELSISSLVEPHLVRPAHAARISRQLFVAVVVIVVVVVVAVASLILLAHATIEIYFYFLPFRVLNHGVP